MLGVVDGMSGIWIRNQVKEKGEMGGTRLRRGPGSGLALKW